jgi:hypothetical protein
MRPEGMEAPYTSLVAGEALGQSVVWKRNITMGETMSIAMPLVKVFSLTLFTSYDFTKTQAPF